MESANQPEDTPQEAEITAIGDASEMTQGTTNRSGPEDKRYKYS